MRRGLIRALIAVLAIAMTGNQLVVRAADTGTIRAWVTVSNKRPPVGCPVEINVEVRAAGEAQVDTAVSVAFSVGNDALSTDKEPTGDDGVAQLTIDTSAAAAGDDGWLDVNIAGVYIGGTSIEPGDDSGDCEGDSSSFSTDAAVPLSASQRESASDAGTSEHVIAGVPTDKQQYSLSCEYAAIYIATSALGDPIPEDDSLAAVPDSANPHDGYRGDINGTWGSTDDYGVYAEPLVSDLKAHGFVGEVSYGADAASLQAQIDAGHPTLVWISTRGDTGFYATDDAGARFKLVPYEHVVVAYGYDDSGVLVSDPGNGTTEHLSWGWFMDAWAVMDGMALAISPA